MLVSFAQMVMLANSKVSKLCILKIVDFLHHHHDNHSTNRQWTMSIRRPLWNTQTWQNTNVYSARRNSTMRNKTTWIWKISLIRSRKEGATMSRCQRSYVSPECVWPLIHGANYLTLFCSAGQWTADESSGNFRFSGSPHLIWYVWCTISFEFDNVAKRHKIPKSWELKYKISANNITFCESYSKSKL